MIINLPAAWWYVAHYRSLRPTAFLVGENVPVLVEEPDHSSAPALRVAGLPEDLDWRSFQGTPVRPVLSPAGQPASIALIEGVDRGALLGNSGVNGADGWLEHPCYLDTTALPAHLRTPHPLHHLMTLGNPSKKPKPVTLYQDLLTARIVKAAARMCAIDGLLYWPAPLPGWVLSFGDLPHLGRCAGPTAVAMRDVPKLYFPSGARAEAIQVAQALGHNETDLAEDLDLPLSCDWTNVASLRSVALHLRTAVLESSELVAEREQLLASAAEALLSRDSVRSGAILREIAGFLCAAGGALQQVGSALLMRAQLLEIDPRDLEALANL